jgi:hypothetical protein
MAESIYTQLESQSVLTPVEGVEFRHALPEGLFPTDKQYESKEELLAWADKNDFTYPLIQKGLQKAIIEVRAAFKACKKDATWTEEMGLANVEEMVWKIVDRPVSGQSDEQKAMTLLGNMSAEDIQAILAKLSK